MTSLKRRLGGSYQNSVIRRAGILLAFVVPAYAANLLILYASADLFSAEQFGVFYVANTLGNVLFSGSLILNVYFTRHLASVAQTEGVEGVFVSARRAQRAVLLWGAVLCTATFVALSVVSDPFGVHSQFIVLLVILDVYTSYLADFSRAILQSLRRTVPLGLYTLAWMMLRLVLCVAGILAFGTVWGALLGVIASTVIVFFGFYRWMGRSARAGTAVARPLPPLLTLMPVILGYGLLIAISNLDVLLSYFLLVQSDLGIYSASSIFPKGILVIVTPVLQLLFPMMIGDHPSNRDLRLIVRKSGVVVFVLTASGVFAVWLLSGWLCGGAWGIKLCRPGPLDILLLSVVPLALLRVLVLIQFARGRDWLALWLIVPTAAYVVAASMSDRRIATVAEQFAAYAAVALAFFGVLVLGDGLLRRGRPT